MRMYCIYYVTKRWEIICDRCLEASSEKSLDMAVVTLVEREVQHDKTHWNAHILECDLCFGRLRLSPTYPSLVA